MYAVGSLAANNIDQIDLLDPLRSLVVVLLLSLLVWGIYYLIFRDILVSGILCTYSLFLIFSYGHIYHLFEGQEIAGFNLGRHRYLGPVWFSLYLVGLVLIVRFRDRLDGISRFLNAFFAILVLIPILQLGSFYYDQTRADRRQAQQLSDELFAGVELPATEELPDVYYIVLDEYARGDLLSEVYDHDNEPFLQTLEEMGFYVARCSQSNYPRTRPSMGSSLNLNYVDQLGFEVEGETDMSWLGVLVENSRTRNILEELGYSFITFETGVPWADFKSADIYLVPPVDEDRPGGVISRANEFEGLLVESSIGILITDSLHRLPWLVGPDSISILEEHRDLILFVLDELERIPEIPGPKFVHVHLLSPHFPVVFGPNGEYVLEQPKSHAAKLEGYRNQVIYLNSRLSPLLQHLIQESDPPPIIILQGDHGPRRIEDPPKEEVRVKILNALLLPDDQAEVLYNSITPVNTFRLVLNSILDAELPLLEDVSYWSERKTPFEFTVIEDDCE